MAVRRNTATIQNRVIPEQETPKTTNNKPKTIKMLSTYISAEYSLFEGKTYADIPSKLADALIKNGDAEKC